ncbi:MAG: ATP synthase F0 subunit C [Deltaproteobacteria bacterium]|nr:ATP synthase F0 subunit C [Deltaproteobacteria bacterium]
MKKFVGLLVVAGLLVGTVSLAVAQPEGAAAATAEGAAAQVEGESLNKGLIAVAAALAIAIAAFGGALAQGRAAAAALEGIARNPGARKDLFVPFILGLALIESLVIYALIIAFMLSGKVG